MAFYSYLSTKIIMAFITKSYQNLFGVRSYINAFVKDKKDEWEVELTMFISSVLGDEMFEKFKIY